MRTRVFLAALCLGVLSAAGSASASGVGSLPAPELSVAGPGCDPQNPANWCLDYSCVTGPDGDAVKYAIEVSAAYCDPPISEGPLKAKFDIGSRDCDAAYPSGTIVSGS